MTARSILSFLLLVFLASPIQAMPIFNSGKDGDTPVVALTFDDGPKEKFTDELLKVLKEKEVRATFFVLGADAAKRSGDLKKIIADGHVIANHSMNHANLKKMTLNGVRRELRECSDLIEKFGGARPRLMRPPGGQYNETVLKACILEGVTPVFWTNNPGDYRGWKDPETLAQKVLNIRKDGDIVLLHLGLEQTVKALPAIIDGYRGAGFNFITIE